ncbi:hypothetical protein FPSE_10038 [Fusarium pseudograminearum CS3096]|uniref:Uncharacterized protein n=1 Tax=Fusarium pseudograminearum (strain CS3096) TaxID=1028729 RepID=K3VY01_FUSPC|nr:hypothetical protein FPSE_10038 [Fusarium pseudograminearum CS3096]EKJ69790.1 hypothetical protein FPSE_10038 [Fusarium pseudograminearum CS3096]
MSNTFPAFDLCLIRLFLLEGIYPS